MALSFSITHKKQELIVPAKPTPREIKATSDLDDQPTFRGHYSVIMFSTSDLYMKEKDPVEVIRDAVSKALVYYYPFAGRLVEGPAGKLMVDCTAEGVAFVEAEATVTLEQLGNTVLPPSPYPDLLLEGNEGILGSPLLFIQVTRLICGGFVLAIRYNHIMTDAIGFHKFFTAVGEMAKGASAPSVPPVWKRELLNARCPPHITHAHPEYDICREEHRRAFPSTEDYLNQNLVRRSFAFGPQEIEAIRKNLSPHLVSSSKFELISACLWRSRTRALRFCPDDIVRITCVVDGRGKDCLNLPQGYYGTAIICPAKVTNAKTLSESPLAYAINLVKQARRQATEEYARSAIDFIVANGRRPAIASDPGSFSVSDCSKLEDNSGFGELVYGGVMYGGVTHNLAIFARYRNRRGEDVTLVPICLPAAVMGRFEDELRTLIWGPAVENPNSTISHATSVPAKL